jgi:hypothetical protein
MKIGLVLFGHLRSFRSAHDSYKNFLKILQHVGDVNVFCHTWDIEDSVTSAWWKDHKPDDPPPATVDKNEIEQTYFPVLYSVEQSRQFDANDYSGNSSIPIPGILSMLYSQMQAFKLLEKYERQNEFKYDVVIKTRYDLLYEITEDFINCIKTNDRIFLPSSNPYELIGSCSDIFAIGSRKNMEAYFDFCENFKEALAIYQQKGYRQLIPELCMTVYLDHKNIKRRELPGLRLHILRMGGEKFQINTVKDLSSNDPHCFHKKMIRRNADILPDGSEILEINSRKLAKKYTSWLDKDANEKTLGIYSDLYNGQWPGIRYIIRLAGKAKHNNVFTSIVMKDFFEESIFKSRYSQLKILILVTILTLTGGSGFYYFRIWKNRVFG